MRTWLARSGWNSSTCADMVLKSLRAIEKNKKTGRTAYSRGWKEEGSIASGVVDERGKTGLRTWCRGSQHPGNGRSVRSEPARGGLAGPPLLPSLLHLQAEKHRAAHSRHGRLDHHRSRAGGRNVVRGGCSRGAGGERTVGERAAYTAISELHVCSNHRVAILIGYPYDQGLRKLG